jgi:hypothetical protein
MEEGCREVSIEARRRLSTCRENTVGYERCMDAGADAQEIDSRISAFASRRREADLAQRRQELEVYRQIEQEQARARALARWLDDTLQMCREQLSEEPCARPGVVAPEERHSCVERCREAIDGAIGRSVASARSACVTRVVESRGSRPADCPDPGLPDDRRLECATGCRDEAAKILALSAAVTPPVVPATTHVPNQATSRSSNNASGGALRCCDGSISPTCACPGHRGCCSHHGGVCGCTN